MIDPRDFRRALGQFPTGVTIVTTTSPTGPIGMTINSFGSVSLSPPLIQFSINRKANSIAAWCAAKHFAVHVLCEDQMELSNRFAKPLTDKWAGIRFRPGLGGVPVLLDMLCVYECSRWADYDGGDHVIFLGKVEALTAPDLASRPPLVFHNGRYRRLAEKSEAPAAVDALLLYGW